MLIVLLGPLSSASPEGQGPLMSWILVVVAIVVLVGAWRNYLKQHKDPKIPLFNVLWISGVCTFILAMGIRGILR